MVTIFEIAQLTPEQLIYQLFLPFILTLVIFFAALQMIGLFSRKINLILSLAITIMVATSPIFAWITNLITQFGAYTALGAFIAVFVIGIGAWTFKRSREYITGIGEEHSELRRLYKERAKLEEKMERTLNERERRAIADRLEYIDRNIRYLETKLRYARK